jgi:hypothetical protein
LVSLSMLHTLIDTPKLKWLRTVDTYSHHRHITQCIAQIAAEQTHTHTVAGCMLSAIVPQTTSLLHSERATTAMANAQQQVLSHALSQHEQHSASHAQSLLEMAMEWRLPSPCDLSLTLLRLHQHLRGVALSPSRDAANNSRISCWQWVGLSAGTYIPPRDSPEPRLSSRVFWTGGFFCGIKNCKIVILEVSNSRESSQDALCAIHAVF